MSEMVERVARAICRAGICGPKEHLDEQENANWRKFTLEARAAIEAMREPTAEMVERTAIQGASPMITAAGPLAMIAHRWRLMIDEALK